MKTLLGLGFLAAGIVIILVLAIGHHNAPPTRSTSPPQSPVITSAPVSPVTTDPRSNLLMQAKNFGVRKVVLTADERDALAKKFTAQIKPAVDKFCQAYSGRVPFKPEDLTLDKFKEEIGRDGSFTIYTFMVDGVTLCLQDSKGRVVVNYINAPQAAQLMKMPGGTAPTVQMSVSRADIIKMVKEDSGTEFQPSDVLIRPTGIYSAMNGGADVSIAPLGGDPNNGLCKVALVFGPDGELDYYCRDPFF